MDVAVRATQFHCPKCEALAEPEGDGPAWCPVCRWHGEVHLFRPLALRVDSAQEALPDDAVCAHHPNKRAVAVCEGTGDYICSLCAIELEGKTYSAQYLDRAGREKLAKAFERYLERPDRRLTACIALSIFFWPSAVVTIPMAIGSFIKLVRLRGQSDIYRRVVGRSQVAASAILVVLLSLGFFALVSALLLR